MDKLPPSLPQPMQNCPSDTLFDTLSTPLSLGKILKSKSRGERRARRLHRQEGLCPREGCAHACCGSTGSEHPETRAARGNPWKRGPRHHPELGLGTREREQAEGQGPTL